MQNPNYRIFMSCALALLLFSSCRKSLYTSLKSEVDDVVETASPSNTPIHAVVSANCAGYYESLPSRYDSNAKKYPMILFLHGKGELGNGTTDLPNMVRAGLPRLIKKKQFPASFEVNGEHFSFIVIAPQFKERPSNEEVNKVLQYMTKKYRVDPARIYVTGLSLGGGVTWEFSSEFGNEVAAIAPVCGGSWPTSKRASGIASFDIPVWAFHNADDKTVPAHYTEDYVNMINSHHPTVPAKFTLWPTGGHDSWTKAYNPETKEDGKNMYEWMLTFKSKSKS
jgi:predicted peptidase